jgi:hypothetical protein
LSIAASSLLAAGQVQIIHRVIQSVGAAGGVYKGQGRSQHDLTTQALEFVVQD